jgi:hypothetical protein
VGLADALMFGYFFWWLCKDKPEPEYEDQPTKELALDSSMQIGISSRAPDYIPAERMRLERPPGRHS